MGDYKCSYSFFCIVVIIIIIIIIIIIKGLDPEKILVLNSKSSNVTGD